MRLKLFDVLIENVLLDGKYTQFGIDLPVDVVNIKVEVKLLFRTQVIEQIDSFYTFTQPFFAQKVFIFANYTDLLIRFPALPLPIDLPRHHIQHRSQPLLDLRGQSLTHIL